MRSLVILIVADLYMEYFGQKALSTTTHPSLDCGSSMWMIHLISKRKITKKNFLEHINCVDLATRFIVKDNKEDGAIPFLDTIVKLETDGRLSITVYRKATHTDQYLQWDSHHHLSAKYSEINTLTYGEIQFAINLNFSKKKWSISEKHSYIASTPNGLWIGWRKAYQANQ